MGLMRAISFKLGAGNLSDGDSSNIKGRPEISLPTELISSTNSVVFTAPSIKLMQSSVPTLVLESIGEAPSTFTIEEEFSPVGTSPTTPAISRRGSQHSSASEPGLTDASSVSSSPTSPASQHTRLEYNSYFSTNSSPRALFKSSVQNLADDSIDPFTLTAPMVPRRAASHSKREHERLARRRSERHLRASHSVTSLSAASTSLEKTTAAVNASPLASSASSELPIINETLNIPNCKHPEQSLSQVRVDAKGPFSQELERLTEAVEELDSSIDDEDTRIMRERGCRRFSVGGYLELVGDAYALPIIV